MPALVALVAGVVRGVTGFGGALVMTAPLALLLGPLLAVPVVLLLESVAAAPMLVKTMPQVRWRVFAPLGIAACAAVPLGAMVLVSADPQLLRRAIAAIVIVFSALLLRGWRYAGHPRLSTSVGLGAQKRVEEVYVDRDEWTRRSILNSARCVLWNREEGSARYFMSGEDLTTQAGLAVQQDLALVSVLGIDVSFLTWDGLRALREILETAVGFLATMQATGAAREVMRIALAWRRISWSSAKPSPAACLARCSASRRRCSPACVECRRSAPVDIPGWAPRCPPTRSRWLVWKPAWTT